MAVRRAWNVNKKKQLRIFRVNLQNPIAQTMGSVGRNQSPIKEPRSIRETGLTGRCILRRGCRIKKRPIFSEWPRRVSCRRDPFRWPAFSTPLNLKVRCLFPLQASSPRSLPLYHINRGSPWLPYLQVTCSAVRYVPCARPESHRTYLTFPASTGKGRVEVKYLLGHCPPNRYLRDLPYAPFSPVAST